MAARGKVGDGKAASKWDTTKAKSSKKAQRRKVGDGNAASSGGTAKAKTSKKSLQRRQWRQSQFGNLQQRSQRRQLRKLLQRPKALRTLLLRRLVQTTLRRKVLLVKKR